MLEDSPFGLLINSFLAPFLRSSINGLFASPVGWGVVLLVIALTSPLAAPCPKLGVHRPSPLLHITLASSPTVLGTFCQWGGLFLGSGASCPACCPGPISALSIPPAVRSARGRFLVVFALYINMYACHFRTSCKAIGEMMVSSHRFQAASLLVKTIPCGFQFAQ